MSAGNITSVDNKIKTPEKDDDEEIKLNSGTSKSPAGLETRRFDDCNHPQKRHFPERSCSDIFSVGQPENFDTSSKESINFRRQKSFWNNVQ